MKESTFKTSFAFLMKLFGMKIDDQIYRTYWELLKSFSDDEYKTIHEKIISSFVPTNQVPFPLPYHFLSASGRDGESRSKLAILAVIKASSMQSIYNSISFGDAALHETIERFGGWPAVACWSDEDWQFKEKNFIATYEAAQICNQGISKCRGIVEFENDTKKIEPERMKIINKNNKTVYFRWSGFDSKLIENKKEEPEAIVDFSEFTKNIGKPIL
jgi:hypothetical protein